MGIFMNADSKNFWELVIAPISATVVAALIIAVGSWGVWVSSSVASFEEHKDNIDGLHTDIQEIKEGVGYLRGRIDAMRDKDA